LKMIQMVFSFHTKLSIVRALLYSKGTNDVWKVASKSWFSPSIGVPCIPDYRSRVYSSRHFNPSSTLNSDQEESPTAGRSGAHATIITS
jgi:hypothetical protein